MTITGKQVFDLALNLIDEVSTDSGQILYDSPDVKTKAINALTILQAELLPNSITPVIVTDLNTNLLLDDRSCLLILPYGLAAHLFIEDESSQASAGFYNARYEELKSKRRATITPITDNYDVLNGMQ